MEERIKELIETLEANGFVVKVDNDFVETGRGYSYLEIKWKALLHKTENDIDIVAKSIPEDKRQVWRKKEYQKIRNHVRFYQDGKLEQCIWSDSQYFKTPWASRELPEIANLDELKAYLLHHRERLFTHDAWEGGEFLLEPIAKIS